MILYIVRHGKPDYQKDCLLPQGHEQARLSAKRLVECGIDEIYCSPMGRAQETAQPTAEALGLPVTTLEWARELGTESKTFFPDGKEKILSVIENDHWLQPAYRSIPMEECFEKVEGFQDHAFPERYREISEGLDALLDDHGYRRTEDGFYLPHHPNDRHIALFCHAGMTRIMLSHLMNIPPQFVVTTLMPHFTGFTIFTFYKDRTCPIMPFLNTYSDIGHLYYPGSGPVHDMRTDENY